MFDVMLTNPIKRRLGGSLTLLSCHHHCLSFLISYHAPSLHLLGVVVFSFLSTVLSSSCPHTGEQTEGYVRLCSYTCTICFHVQVCPLVHCPCVLVTYLLCVIIVSRRVQFVLCVWSSPCSKHFVLQMCFL